MSEAKSSKKASKAKAETKSTPKAETKSKSTDAAPKAAESTESTPAASSSTDTKSSDSGSDSGTDGGKEAGKSARESAGGTADAHYGYFSSVRTPAYRSGWDDIWGNGNGTNGAGEDEAPGQRRAARASRPAKARKRRDPITVTLDLDALPPSLKNALVELARAELKKSRVSYERRDKAGAIDWRITCRAD